MVPHENTVQVKFHLHIKGHTLEFHVETYSREPPCTAYQILPLTVQQEHPHTCTLHLVLTKC